MKWRRELKSYEIGDVQKKTGEELEKKIKGTTPSLLKVHRQKTHRYVSYVVPLYFLSKQSSEVVTQPEIDMTRYKTM